MKSQSLKLLLIFLLSSILSATTFSTSVSHNDDDAEQTVGNNTAYLDSSDLELVYDGSDNKQIVGIRFRHVDIPKNATIINAYIKFKAKSNHSADVSLKISAENVGNSAVFEEKKRNISNRSKTSSVDWNHVESWSKNNLYNTPNIASLVQTVIDRADWAQNNPITFLIERKNKNNYRRAYSKDSGKTPPKLVIEYTSTSTSSGCDSSLDTSANDNAPGVAIPGMNHTTTDQTACVSGSSVDDDKDYYYFIVDTDGTLEIDTSSPNGNNYHFQVQSTVNGTIHPYDTDQDRSLSFNLVAGEKITFYSKETGSDTDQWQVNLSFNASDDGGDDASTSDADICYETPYTENTNLISFCTGFGGINCKNIIPIRNTSGTDLTSVDVYLTSTGILNGSFNLSNDSCGVEDNKGSCESSSNIEVGPVSILGQSLSYALDDMSSSDTDRNTYTQSTVSIDFNNKQLYSTYTKDEVEYTVEVLSCDNAVVIPKISVNDASVLTSTSTQTMTFIVDITPNATNSSSTVHYYTQDGTAQSGTDYTSVDDTLTLPSGTSTAEITVEISADAEGEFYLILDKPFNTGIEDNNATGTISTALVCQNYDTGNSTSYIDIQDIPNTIPDIISAGKVVQNMNHVDANRTACIYGSSENGNYDYYYFEVDADGRLEINATSPNSHVYGLKITADGGYYYGTEEYEEHHPDTIYMHAGDSVYLRIKETGSDTDEYEITFNYIVGGNIAGDRPFTIRNPEPTRNIRGNYVIGGNMNLCEDDGTGHCKNNNSNSNSHPDIYIDIDSDPTTYNSTSFDLNVTSGSTIVWAGLYWQGVVHKSNSTGDFLGETVPSNAPLVHSSTKEVDLTDNTYGADKVKFKLPGASYVEVTADQLDYANLGYAGFKDVTGMLNLTDPNGTYYLADIKCHTGAESNHGNYGAWALVVIYENPDEEYRNVTLFDGYATVDSNYNEDLEIGGFITSSKTPVNSKIAFFAMDGEGGPNSLSVESVKAGTNRKVSGPGNPENALFNSTIIGVNNRQPNVPSLRFDLDIIDLENYLAPLETQAILRPRTNGDRYTPSFFIMSSTLYIPKFCYDYAYKQNDIYFTEKNDGSKNPKLVGSVDSSSIEMAIYIKNEVDSDIQVNNFKLNVLDINTSQVIYRRESTKLTPIDSVTANTISDSSLEVSDSFIKNINIGDIGSNQYFYTYYDLEPQTSSLDMPIKVVANYDLTLSGESIPYFLELGSQLNLCTDNNFRYQPAKSIFNIVHNNYYNNSTTYYNLPTQITNREGNFKVISLEPDNPDTLAPRSTIVAVEMIDASAFHDTNASCQQLSSSIAPRVWITFDDNVTSTMFDKQAIKDAITNNMTTLSDSTDFYKVARQNAAFRITYNAVDNNGSIVQLDKIATNQYKIINYTELTDGISVCANNNTHSIESQCSVNDAILTKSQLAQCMECVYGYQTKFICSRDNFAIRPESFLIKLNDVNQSDLTQTLRLANTISGNSNPTLQELQLAAGYEYSIEINATNHKNNNASKGYTRTFTTTSSTDLIHSIWEPRGGSTLGCNDTSNIIHDYRFSDGTINSNFNIDQVGDYRLNAIDTLWSSVDHISAYMTHHTGSYYLAGTDCIENNNSSQLVNSSFLNGCNISSDHINYDAKDSTDTTITLKYNDYDLELHPYKFDITNILSSVGTLSTSIGANSYIYMADMSQDINMSTHFRGNIEAKGYNETQLSNFVDNCYAKPLDITIDKTNYVNSSLAYQYRFSARSSDGSLDYNVSGDLNNTNTPINLATSGFQKDQNGTTFSDLNLNFNRSIDKAVNSETITFNKYTVDCTVTADCTMSADLTTKTATQTNTLNQTVKHFYARTYVPRQRFTAATGTAPIYYEIYCDANGKREILPNALNSRYNDDPRWFVNTLHTSSFGSATSIAQKVGSSVIVVTPPTGNAPDSATLKYTGSSYPYKTTMSVSPSSWLIYNKYNPSTTTNDFIVEFINSNSAWAGKKSTDTTTKTTGSATTNRRSMW